MQEDTSPLTVVLVHGAFADASSWSGVVERLQAAGIEVVAPANPLRGIAHDSAYVGSVIEQIPGRVLAVGHSYGGAVISNVARGERRRSGLRRRVRPGRRRGPRGSGSRLEGQRPDERARSPGTYPAGDGEETEFAIDPEKFRDAFAADLPPEQTAVMAATQRPVAEAAFSEPIGSARMEVAPELGRGRHGRQGGRCRRHPLDGRASGRHDHRRVDGSHVIMISRPEAVAEVVVNAAAAVDRAAAGAIR